MAERWEIPFSKQTRALQMDANGYSFRQIYTNLWPTEPPCSLHQFTNAMTVLKAQTEGYVAALARSAGVPTQKEFTDALLDDDKMAELCLAPAVQELPLPPGDAEALAHLDAGRVMLLQAMYQTSQKDEQEFQTKGTVPIAAKAQVLATLNNALVANVSTRLRAMQLRVHRAVVHHNLRLARRDEAAETLREIEASDRPTTPSSPGFVIDLPNN